MDGHFTEFDHSGDIGIEAHGKDLQEVLVQLTGGLFQLMCRGRVEEKVKRRVRIQSNSAEDLVVDWLSEVLSLSAVHGEMYGSVTVRGLKGHCFDAVIAGEKLDPAKHDLRFEVKAATYHGLRLEEVGDGWMARVIFDL